MFNSLDESLTDKTFVAKKSHIDESVELELLVKDENEKVYPLNLKPLSIGREQSCKITIPSNKASRYHAILYRFGASYVLKDLGSTNGTLLNGAPTSFSPISIGDTIQIGDSNLTIVKGENKRIPYLEDCVVVFLDLAQYTNMCEKYGDEFSSYVREIMQQFEISLLLSQGLVIQHLGDAIMGAVGLWPTETPAGEPLNPCELALKFIYSATQQIKTFDKYPDPVKIRVGASCGPVHVHPTESLGFHLVGNVTNLAARLESANKMYGTTVLLDDGLVSALEDKSMLRELDTIRVKGKQEPTTLYTFKGEANKAQDSYYKGLTLYRQGELKDALKEFKHAISLNDPPGQLMAKRTKQILMETNFQGYPDWDGIWNMTSK